MQNIFFYGCLDIKNRKSGPENDWSTVKPVDNMILFGTGKASLCFHSHSSWSTTERKGRLQNMRWLCFVAWLQLSPTSYTTHKPPDLWTFEKVFVSNCKKYLCWFLESICLIRIKWLQLSPTSYTTHKPPDLWTLPTSNGKCFKANVNHYHNFDNIHLLSESRLLISWGILQVHDDDDDRNLKTY